VTAAAAAFRRGRMSPRQRPAVWGVRSPGRRRRWRLSPMRHRCWAAARRPCRRPPAPCHPGAATHSSMSVTDVTTNTAALRRAYIPVCHHRQAAGSTGGSVTHLLLLPCGLGRALRLLLCPLLRPQSGPRLLLLRLLLLLLVLLTIVSPPCIKYCILYFIILHHTCM
jgi:hypothetical protein